ncbi:MAG: AAA family ATPase [Thiomicrorhabdus chilensis]|uniref:bifunctional aminoglycoside phosphotransferase/ATP-binding protein n=1 Tax=Thiomicrorhabdus chilensis TaxID=63656 RepID=UPI00299E8347|nr:AAA family ATPase [Thiomicrorhabdus chilensis]MDX1348213.1 AAA family ATPase [Thiomicrorhabdus chilensis]
MDTETLIDLLCLPESYPHPVELITTIETHISVVFLTGPFAYKLKKPVDFGFLDFTQLADRQYFCQQELRLNRRTAPTLYLDVLPLYLTEQGKITFEQSLAEDSRPVEYLLKMNQFDPNGVLGRYLRSNELTATQRFLLAHKIYELHHGACRVEKNSHLGEPETILQPMLDNFPTLLENCRSDYQTRLRQLLSWTRQQYKDLHPTLKQRKADGFVRECHGDLHLDNITLIEEVPTLFDGIEFNDEFRWIDVISDLAFLLIDLDFRKQTMLKRYVLNTYLAMSGDYQALSLLRFYQVYRALVRAKISALRLNQLNKQTLEYQEYRNTTLQYIEQAEDYAFEQTPPRLFLLQGISGSGKSHFAEQMLELVDAIIISSDIERKRLYGISPTTRVDVALKAELYSPEMSRRTYRRLLDLAAEILQQGRSVMVDATFLKEDHRRPFMELAQDMGFDFGLVFIDVEEEFAKKSIEQRIQLDDSPSDADVDVMRRQLTLLEPPTSREPSLTLKAKEIRRVFPLAQLQNYLDLPINN